VAGVSTERVTKEAQRSLEGLACRKDAPGKAVGKVFRPIPLDDRGRLAPLPAGREGRGDGWDRPRAALPFPSKAN
jgi:hypothetical protein